jgi:hypothetical protein
MSAAGGARTARIVAIFMANDEVEAQQEVVERHMVFGASPQARAMRTSFGKAARLGALPPCRAA